MNLDGRRILVTGAGSGIGAAIAAACVAAGAAVAVNDVDAERAAETARAVGGLAVPGDAADVDATTAFVSDAASGLDGLDGLVNNAGIVAKAGLDDVEVADWDRVMRVNLRSVFLTSKAFAGLATHPSAVVNLASIAHAHPTPGTHAYSPSKAGVVALTRQMALEWGPAGLRANAIAPGMISGTNMSAAESDELRRRRGSVVPLGRTGQPDDVADAAVFLLSDAARYITGQVLGVDGGWSVSLLSFTPRPWE